MSLTKDSKHLYNHHLARTHLITVICHCNHQFKRPMEVNLELIINKSIKEKLRSNRRQGVKRPLIQICNSNNSRVVPHQLHCSRHHTRLSSQLLSQSPRQYSIMAGLTLQVAAVDRPKEVLIHSRWHKLWGSTTRSLSRIWWSHHHQLPAELTLFL